MQEENAHDLEAVSTRGAKVYMRGMRRCIREACVGPYCEASPHSYVRMAISGMGVSALKSRMTMRRLSGPCTAQSKVTVGDTEIT